MVPMNSVPIDDITLFVKKPSCRKAVEKSVTAAVKQTFGIVNVATAPIIFKNESNEFTSSDPNATFCKRCGRCSHEVQQCSANTDIQGAPCAPNTLLKSRKRKADERAEQQIKSRQRKKELLLKQRKQSTPCKVWAEGKCILGNNCSFSHDGPGFDPRSKQLCEYYRVNTCTRGDRCYYSHVKKNFPCIFHHIKGSCKRGIECEYSHDPLTLEQKQAIELDNARYANRHSK
jgi:hypothetical protein